MIESVNIKHKGGCHCGAVSYEVMAPADLIVSRCNCSICAMTGFTHLIVPASRFKLLSGQNDLIDYTFNTGVARHRFCRHCGVKSFYVPRSNPDGFSINLNCLDRQSIRSIVYDDFDGQNWEDSAEVLRHLSQER